MKKHTLLHLLVLVCIPYNTTIATPNHSKEQPVFIEKWLPTVYKVAWMGMVATEAISFMFPSIHYALYGTNNVAINTKKIIFDSLSSVGLQQPLDIRESRSLWTSLGENAFSHRGTFFINPKAFNQNDLSPSLKKDIVSAAVAMNYNYDARILGASIIIPLTVWTIAHYANVLIQKINQSNNTSWLTKKIVELDEHYKKSFFIKTGVSLGIISAYILYQKHLIANIANMLIAGKQHARIK
ncbi:MAG TPA: hypothetical protein VLB80_01780 [Candidatus Babeliales bacterium]|nr:hypothetical protein [Candidatus Babeliales bacterium]